MKAETAVPPLYRKYYVEKKDERLELFRILAGQFGIRKGLYPGSFAHITPSFIIAEMVYVDSDKRCGRFFGDTRTAAFVAHNKHYDETPVIRFHAADFTRHIAEKDGYFDLLISLYSGFISKYCARYLKKGGLLLANSSHGDAALARLNRSFELVSVVKRRGERFSISNTELDSYLIPKSGRALDRAEIEKTMRGPACSKSAYAYVFRKKSKGKRLRLSSARIA